MRKELRLSVVLAVGIAAGPGAGALDNARSGPERASACSPALLATAPKAKARVTLIFLGLAASPRVIS